MTLGMSFWNNEKGYLLAALLPAINDVAQAGAALGAQKLLNAGVSVDPDLVNARASEWAKSHTQTLLERLNSYTQAGVNDAVANWIATPGATRADLENALLPLLSDNVTRAESIGVTEVTRAITQGEYIAYEAAGIQMPPGFDTGLGNSLRFGPPAHPNCRCWTRIVRLADNTWVVVWQTNRDELVCKRTLDTPWGKVSGCKALNNRVLSIGPYLGMTLKQAQAEAKKRVSND